MGVAEYRGREPAAAESAPAENDGIADGRIRASQLRPTGGLAYVSHAVLEPPIGTAGRDARRLNGIAHVRSSRSAWRTVGRAPPPTGRAPASQRLSAGWRAAHIA